MYETVITNLPAERFPASLLHMLYHKRWGIETAFLDLKYPLALTHFHAKKRPFIMQEIFARMTLCNFTSLLRLHTCFMQPKGKYPYRLNAAFAAHIAWKFLLDNGGKINRRSGGAQAAWQYRSRCSGCRPALHGPWPGRDFHRSGEPGVRRNPR